MATFQDQIQDYTTPDSSEELAAEILKPYATNDGSYNKEQIGAALGEVLAAMLDRRKVRLTPEMVASLLPMGLVDAAKQLVPSTGTSFLSAMMPAILKTDAFQQVVSGLVQSVGGQ